MDLYAIPKKSTKEPTRDELLALSRRERQFWFQVDERHHLEDIARLLNIPNAQDALLEEIVTKFERNGWIRF